MNGVAPSTWRSWTCFFSLANSYQSCNPYTPIQHLFTTFCPLYPTPMYIFFLIPYTALKVGYVSFVQVIHFKGRFPLFTQELLSTASFNLKDHVIKTWPSQKSQTQSQDWLTCLMFYTLHISVSLINICRWI
jgi:hypothetical protein